ncbi:hypothetical protein MHU86_23479 [Fragilaria crotonensis]|nr:hypothetical protein MHU86_23479 [Fragilaria crotonensis]
MPTLDDLHDAVRIAMKTGLPLARPITGMQLLQFIGNADVEWYGGILRRKYVLKESKHPSDTLIKYVDLHANHHKEPLQRILDAQDQQYLRPSDVLRSHSSETEASTSVPLQGAGILRFGFMSKNKKKFSIEFGNGQILRKSVSTMNLIDFLDDHEVKRRRSLTNMKGVVTAVYCITGKLVYKGTTVHVTSGGAHLNTAPNLPINVTAGFMETNTEGVILPENTEESGGLTNTVNSSSVTAGGVQSNATPTGPVNVNTGFQSTLANMEDALLPETNTEESGESTSVAAGTVQSGLTSIAPVNYTARLQRTMASSEAVSVSPSDTDEWIIAVDILEFDEQERGSNRLKFVAP